MDKAQLTTAAIAATGVGSAANDGTDESSVTAASRASRVFVMRRF